MLEGYPNPLLAYDINKVWFQTLVQVEYQIHEGNQTEEQIRDQVNVRLGINVIQRKQFDLLCENKIAT